jgi:transposase
MTVRVIVTAGTIADCTQAGGLIDGIEADVLIADKGYDSDEIVGMALSAKMLPVIPPRSNRKEQRDYDRYLYRLRHLVENAFMMMKQWRGIATRYAKNSASYLAAVHVRCIFMWAKVCAPKTIDDRL